MTPPINNIPVTSENIGDFADNELLNETNLTDVEKEVVIIEKQKRLSANLNDNQKSQPGEKKESKEIFTKSLEFEKDTFKVDSKWREEVTKKSAKKNPFLQKFLNKGIKIKANKEWNIVEFMEDTLHWHWNLVCKAGEQLFIDYDIFIREVKKFKNCSTQEVEEKYLMTDDELKEKMKDKPSGSEEYEKFFDEEIKDHLAGYWGNTDDWRFYNVGVWFYVWLVGGSVAGFGRNRWGQDKRGRNYGFSGRLLKN